MTLIIVTVASAAQVLKIVPMALVGIVALGVVVVVHELGHFITAKRAGVKVEAFSIGFGPKIWGIKRGETEYRIGLIFFGGYVKMKGMEGEAGKEPHLVEGGFFAAKPARRAFIAFAGPTMNVFLALAVFTLLWFTGTKVPLGVLTTTIGYLEKKSPARKAGLVPGDTILKINDNAVHEWKDIMAAVAFSHTNRVDLTFAHNGTILNTTILVEPDKEAGFRHLRVYPRMDVLVSEVKEGSLADKLSLSKGDKLLSVAGEPLYHIDHFRTILRRNIGKEVNLIVSRRTKTSGELAFSFTVPLPEDGIHVNSVRDRSLARKAGLKNGDLIVTAGGRNVYTISALEEILNENRGKEVKIEVLRGKHPESKRNSRESPGYNLLGARLEEGFPILGFAPGVVYGVRKERPVFATYSAIKNVVLTLKGLITRRVSTKGISGPVGIVGMIARSISISFTTFLYFIGFLSANFAIINLLPIPIVDGGHIMFCAIEKVRGKPIRQKTMTAIINTFFILILAFFLFVTKNDILRFFTARGKEAPARKKVVLSLTVPQEGLSSSTQQQQSAPPQE